MWRYSIGGLKWQAYFELNVWLPSPKDTNTDVPFRSVWHLLLPQPLLWPCIINLRRRWSDSLLNETIQQLRCNWAVTWSWTEVPWTPRSSLDTCHGASFGLFFNPENMDNWEHLKKRLFHSYLLCILFCARFYPWNRKGAGMPKSIAAFTTTVPGTE